MELFNKETKMMKNKLTIPALVILAISMLACAKTEKEVTAATVKQHTNSTLSGSTKDSYAKPGAPVQLSHVTTKVDVGETSNIDLIFSTQAIDEMNKGGIIAVKITADEGLNLHGLTSSFDIQLEPNKTDYPLSFTADATLSKHYYINVFVSMQVGANTMNRAFAVPVQIGNETQVLKSSGSVGRDENNQPVISMPAQETIK
jgi:hypothetical protein